MSRNEEEQFIFAITYEDITTFVDFNPKELTIAEVKDLIIIEMGIESDGVIFSANEETESDLELYFSEVAELVPVE